MHTIIIAFSMPVLHWVQCDLDEWREDVKLILLLCSSLTAKLKCGRLWQLELQAVVTNTMHSEVLLEGVDVPLGSCI